MNKWLQTCTRWKNKWASFPVEYNDNKNGIDLYKFIEVLNCHLKKDSVVTCDAGSAAYVTNQGLRFYSTKQKLISPLAQGGMGTVLSMSAGVSLAKKHGEVICCIGDGSFNTNPQSLAVVKQHKLPIKIFVWNNFGYLSIKNSQDKFYGGRRIGTSSKDGIYFPEVKNVAKTYGIKYLKVGKINTLNKTIGRAMLLNEPCIIEIICKEIQDITPSITAFKNSDGKMEQHDFSNMFPFLPPDEYELETKYAIQ